MVRDSFAAFILSNGRADNVLTIDTLNRCGYTGKWYILLDDGDSQLNRYVENFGKEHIIIFSKKDAIKYFDIMDNFEGDKVPTFARNALNKIAKDMGFDYFWELEDDYRRFTFRHEVAGHLCTTNIEDLDSVIEAFLDYLDSAKLKTVAFAQMGEMMGGVNSEIFRNKLKRKAMNTFFFRTDNTYPFLGRFNDDVNAYITFGKTGDVILQVADVSLDQPPTQKSSGGISESYKKFGTYVKSFYSIMLRPDCVKIDMMGDKDLRIHHKIDWETCVPKIVSDKYKVN